MLQTDTIAAISTPHGKGGIAVIRISGIDALSVASVCFHPASGCPLCEISGGRAIYGTILDGSEVLDDGIAAVFRAPRSFTGEDTVEISCHGGILNTERVLSAVLAAGASPAGPGEFTRRAFLSGKLSLSEAEAVADLIDAKTERMRKLSRDTVNGALSGVLTAFYDELLAIVSSVYVIIDYPEEDLSDLSPAELRARLVKFSGKVRKLLDTYRAGRAIHEGIETAICGRPNVGKSAVYNRLLGEERAIVTDTAGTTRDLLYGSAVCGDVLLNLCDTAGLRETDDQIEAIGVERARKRMEDAELVFAVFDTSQPLTGEDLEIAQALSESGKECIALLNKSDLPVCADTGKLDAYFRTLIRVSAANGEGFDAIAEAIRERYLSGVIGEDSGAILYNARQHAALSRCAEAVDRAVAALDAGFATDVASSDLELALGALGECDGRSVSEDIVAQIFSRFCVGK